MLRACIVLVVCAVGVANSYTFQCFRDLCQCDTETRVVDCHSQNLFYVPDMETRSPLHGFTVLSLRQNCLTEFTATEQQLLRAMPDLEAIDLHLNSFTSCSDVRQLRFDRVHVMSECTDASTAQGAAATAYQVANGAVDGNVIIDESTPPDWLVRRWAECSVQATQQREPTCGEWTEVGCHATRALEKLKVVVKKTWTKIEAVWNENKNHIPGYPEIERTVRKWINDLTNL